MRIRITARSLAGGSRGDIVEVAEEAGAAYIAAGFASSLADNDHPSMQPVPEEPASRKQRKPAQDDDE